MKAVFLDRDGTVIVDQHYLADPNLIEFIPGALEGLKKLQLHGYKLFIVSNQSGIGRGKITDEQFQKVHERFSSLLNENGILIEQYLYCFHHPDDPCQCRKPRTGLIPKTVSNQPIVFEESYTIGDKKCDLELGRALHAKGCLVLTGYGRETYSQLEIDGELEQYLWGESLIDVVNTVVSGQC